MLGSAKVKYPKKSGKSVFYIIFLHVYRMTFSVRPQADLYVI